MNLGKSFPISVLAERTVHHPMTRPVATWDGGWIISFSDRPEIIFLDDDLNETHRLDPGVHSEDYCNPEFALSRQGRWLAASSRSEMRISDRQGVILYSFPHVAWASFTGSACHFDSQDRLWYVRPGDVYRLTVVDPQSGVILTEHAMPSSCRYGHYMFSPLPNDEGTLIDVSFQQNGTLLFLARLTDTGLTIQEYPFSDRTFTRGFSPDGSEFVTGAHYGEAVQVHAFPSGEVLAEIDSDTLFAADDPPVEARWAVGYNAFFLNKDYILIDTGARRIMLIERRSMQPLGTLWPPGYELDRHEPNSVLSGDSYYLGSLEYLCPAGQGRVLATFYMGNNNTLLRILDVSSLLSTSAALGLLRL